MSNKQADRRAFLKTMGVAVPASIVAAPPAHGLPQNVLSPREVFETYVAECLHRLPQHGLTTEPGSVLRTIIEIQGAALATVLAELQHREDKAS